MKTIFTIPLILMSICAMAQPYTDNDKLLTSEKHHSLYIVLNDSTAYYDNWGGKKYITYFLIHTLKKENEHTYQGTSHSLHKQGSDWVLKDINTSSEIIYNLADTSQYYSWTSLINWLRYLDIGQAIDKFEQTNEGLYQEMRVDLLKLTRINGYGNKPTESIDEYKLLLNELYNKYNNYIISIPLYHYRPMPEEKFLSPAYYSKK